MTDPDRVVRAGDLVALGDVANRLGVPRSRVYDRLKGRAQGTQPRADVPRPVAVAASVELWLWPEVEAWYRSFQPQKPGGPGRPVKRTRKPVPQAQPAWAEPKPEPKPERPKCRWTASCQNRALNGRAFCRPHQDMWERPAKDAA
jgi:predicted DNA-binding transcriptional regulator AlpA